MKRKNALFILGTRPEAIKVAPLIIHMRDKSKKYNPVLCITGQHKEMLDQALETFGLIPKHNLSVMKANQTLSDVSSSILSQLPAVIAETNPSLMIVQGDTNTAFCAAVCAYYHQVPLAHVEAGLRTWNIHEPFPEEGIRRMISPLASVHFAPTTWARDNLLKENVLRKDVHVTGNSVIDALHYVLKNYKNFTHDIFKKIENYSKVILVTAHRRESFGNAFQDICFALKDIALRHPEICIVYPVHLNPNVRQPVMQILTGVENIFLIEPLDYVTFVQLMSKSYLVITDSGGIQEEAPSLGIPVLLMRDKTERPEGIKAGLTKIVGTDRGVILKTASLLLNSRAHYQKMKKKTSPYGNGKTSEKILKILEKLDY